MIGERRAIVVDDDEAVLRTHARVLAKDGFHVVTATSGAAAIRAMEAESFDVILSDIDMPGMTGLALLERVRTFDLDVSMVLITGCPSMASAIKAIEYGAYRYVVKPIGQKDLVALANDGVRLHRLALAKREALAIAGGFERFAGDQAGLVASFANALATMHMVYQPIIAWPGKTVFAYEALLRSRDATLPHPLAIIDAAERLGRVHDVGRAIRAAVALQFAQLPDDALLFVNLHPSDLLDDQLFRHDSPLAGAARRVVLEITERASLHGMDDVPARIRRLRDLGFRIALDDLGAGYAGLTSFALLEPDFVKLDIGLIHDVDREPTKQTLVRTMVQMCGELGITVIAEGIERPGERDELERERCQLMQGYLFAHPGTAFPPPVF